MEPSSSKSSDGEIVSDDERYNDLKLLMNEEPVTRKTKYNTLELTDIQDVPGAYELYGSYTAHRIKTLRILHSVGYGLELFCFIMGNLIETPKVTEHSVTPLTPHYVFIMIGWCIHLILGIPFMHVVYQNTLTAVDLIAEQYKFYYIATYPLLRIFFLCKNFTESLAVCIVCSVLLGVCALVLYWVYHRVKYLDDGRYFVTRIEFISVHIRISIFVAWVVVSLANHIFICVVHWNDQEFLDWSNSNWSIFSLVVIFACGCISLSSYKDAFFATMLSFAFLGIYVEQ
jgi:hypothetical protein